MKRTVTICGEPYEIGCHRCLACRLAETRIDRNDWKSMAELAVRKLRKAKKLALRITKEEGEA